MVRVWLIYLLFESKTICDLSNCQLNETMIAQLKKKLTTTENNLTDIRLEALSSVHQVDQLKEYLEKLKIDMMSLKSENQLLKKYIKEIKTKRVNRSKLETDDMFMEYLSNDDSSAENQDDTTMIDVCNFSSNYYYSYGNLVDYFILNSTSTLFLKTFYSTMRMNHSCERF